MSINTKGFVELSDQLDKPLTPELNRTVLKIANFMENTARKNLIGVVYSIPKPWKRTGKARQSIISQPVGEGAAKVYMGVDYGMHLEFGTKPHTIKPKGAKKLLMWPNFSGKTSIKTKKTSYRKTGWSFAKIVNHPGTKPHPFWIPAVKATAEKFPEYVTSVIENHFE